MRTTLRLVSFSALLLAPTAAASAAPILPSYSATYTDCTTFDTQTANTEGKQRWTIKTGCDSYQNEFYERPTTQTYQVNQTSGGEIFAATEYFQNIDIVMALAGFDSTYLYTAIDLAGLSHLTESGSSVEGLNYEYQFLLSTNADGGSGYWFCILDGTQLTTSYSLIGEGQKDVDGDVGGAGISITKQDGLAESVGLDGYETDWIDAGNLKSTGAPVLYARISPTDPTVIEFAVDYGALGLTQTDLLSIISGQSGYLDFRAIKGDPNDPQNYMWNDNYTKSEAGSPYRYVSGPCPDGSSSPTTSKSEFCTQGLSNIYELDTLRATPQQVPEPGSLLLIGTALFGVCARRWGRHRA